MPPPSKNKNKNSTTYKIEKGANIWVHCTYCFMRILFQLCAVTIQFVCTVLWCSLCISVFLIQGRKWKDWKAMIVEETCMTDWIRELLRFLLTKIWCNLMPLIQISHSTVQRIFKEAWASVNPLTSSSYWQPKMLNIGQASHKGVSFPCGYQCFD